MHLSFHKNYCTLELCVYLSRLQSNDCGVHKRLHDTCNLQWLLRIAVYSLNRSYEARSIEYAQYFDARIPWRRATDILTEYSVRCKHSGRRDLHLISDCMIRRCVVSSLHVNYITNAVTETSASVSRSYFISTLITSCPNVITISSTLPRGTVGEALPRINNIYIYCFVWNMELQWN